MIISLTILAGGTFIPGLLILQKFRIGRLAGGVLVGLYIAYLVYNIYLAIQ